MGRSVLQSVKQNNSLLSLYIFNTYSSVSTKKNYTHINSVLTYLFKINTWSNARVKNVAKVETKATVLSLHAAPVATPTRFCSAMKHSIYLSGATCNKLNNVKQI